METRRANPRRDRSYSAHDIEILEGLEPVRRRPGMYVGGTDQTALHHLAAELLDNALDEVSAKAARKVSLSLVARNRIVVTDDGRGIPVEPHPKFPKQSTLEILLTTLHSGAKFQPGAYKTSGGLHGVGLSVVNALAQELRIHTVRDRTCWTQAYEQGKPLGKLKKCNPHDHPNRKSGTSVEFSPDESIFGKNAEFSPVRLFEMLRTRAFLFPGLTLHWNARKQALSPEDAKKIPLKAEIHAPDGLSALLKEIAGDRPLVEEAIFADRAKVNGIKMEWAIAWLQNPQEDGQALTFCNAVPTPLGGAHEQGLRNGITQAVREHGARIGDKRAADLQADDALGGAIAVLSLFMQQPQFQGQTKERLSNTEVTKPVAQALRDHAAHWYAEAPARAAKILDAVRDRQSRRIAEREAKAMRKSLSPRNSRLPGKLVDCSSSRVEETEIFLVEGDSAGGSAKQARDRRTQAVLPLRGKILNAVSASDEKRKANRELSDLLLALGCTPRKPGGETRKNALRYGRIIIMTDADVDGAHIAALLLSFFCRELPELIDGGHVYLAQPPLLRLRAKGRSAYALDEQEAAQMERTLFKDSGTIERSRFKGLGEMMPQQLRETTMDPAHRQLLQVQFAPGKKSASEDRKRAQTLIEALLGRNAEKRLQFVRTQLERAGEELALDV